MLKDVGLRFCWPNPCFHPGGAGRDNKSRSLKLYNFFPTLCMNHHLQKNQWNSFLLRWNCCDVKCFLLWPLFTFLFPLFTVPTFFVDPLDIWCAGLTQWIFDSAVTFHASSDIFGDFPLVIVLHGSLFTAPLLQALNITVCTHTSICVHMYVYKYLLKLCVHMCMFVNGVRTYQKVHTCICVHVRERNKTNLTGQFKKPKESLFTTFLQMLNEIAPQRLLLWAGHWLSSPRKSQWLFNVLNPVAIGFEAWLVIFRLQVIMATGFNRR